MLVRLPLFALAVFLSVFAAPTGAQVRHLEVDRRPATPADDPSEIQLLTYTWDDNMSFPGAVRTKQYLFVSVPPGESIQGIYGIDKGDPNWVWHISKDNKRLFLSPEKGNLSAALTLVTDQRDYLLALRSVDRGVWQQRIRFVVEGRRAAGPRSGPVMYEAESPAGFVVTKPKNRRYRVEGKTEFTPVEVFDDGDATYFRFPPKMPEMPAAFVLDADGNPQIQDYAVAANEIKVPRLARAYKLWLGSEAVFVYRADGSSDSLNTTGHASKVGQSGYIN